MICGACKNQVNIDRSLIEVGGETVEIEITSCPKCKIISYFSIDGYTWRSD